MADVVVVVLVVGAGVVGASVAWHAAWLGAGVTLVDQGLPASGVTGDSFAWIGASGGAPGPVAAQVGDRAVRRLEAEQPGVGVRWTGSLSWPCASEETPTRTATAGSRWTPAEAALLEPDLVDPPAPGGAHHR